MEQRPLRLGDIVDDYCPRERRVTNHVVVALVEDSIRQTRCTTCDADHVYKGGREPRRKLVKKETSALYDEVLANVTGAPGTTPAPASPPADAPPAMIASPGEPRVAAPAAASAAEQNSAEPEQPEPSRDELWPAHRQLIRATLPRTDNEPPQPRPIPEFTMHQRQPRGGQGFRQGWQGGNGHSRNGFRPPRDGQGNGFGGGRPAGGRGRHRGRGGKKPQ
jgi:hypothetical protein